VNRGPKQHHTRPAVDPLFESAARAHGTRVVGVVLTGGGDDGLHGLLAIEAAGGLSIAQDPAEAAFPWMPANAIRYDRVNLILPLAAIAGTLVALARGEAVEKV
jgi:two-component system chemotaxis response regulator CheB